MATANIEAELQKILNGLGDMPGIVGKLGDVVARLASALNPLQGAISKLIGLGNAEDTVLETAQATASTLLTAAVNRNSMSTDANTAATVKLTATVTSLNAMLASLIAKMNASLSRQGFDQLGGGKSPLMLGGGDPPEGDEGGGVSSGVSMLKKLGAVAAVAAASIAVFAVAINLAEREFQKLQGLVKLFNPAVIQTFQYALDNLGATIGRAFVPMFQMATGVIREWTAALAPVIQKLTPMIQEFSEAFANLAIPMLQALAAVIQSMLPMFRMMAETAAFFGALLAVLVQQFAILFRSVMLGVRVMMELAGIGIVVRVLTKVLEAFSKIVEVISAAFDIMEVVVTSMIDGFAAFISSILPVKSIMDSLARAVQTVIRGMYVLAIMMAKFLGLDGVVNALLDSVAGKTMRGDTAAQTPQLKTIDQLSKDLALAASTAAGAAGKGGVRNEQEFWKQTLEQMRNAERNGVSIRQVLDMILAEIRKLIPGGGGAAQAPPGPANPGPGGVGWADRIADGIGAIANPGAWLFKKAIQ